MTRDSQPANEALDVRLDKWLWAARLFKTRALAVEAVEGGKVHVNGARAKPSRSMRIGDELRVRRGTDEHVYIVAGLSRQRGPAPVAQTLYAETAESLAAHAARIEQRRALGTPLPSRRPDKKGRRQIHRFLRGG